MVEHARSIDNLGAFFTASPELSGTGVVGQKLFWSSKLLSGSGDLIAVMDSGQMEVKVGRELTIGEV